MKLYAFWMSDVFPYVNGGEITAMDGKGQVETKEYGAGYWFQPKKILPVAEGTIIMAKLRQLSVDYDTAKNHLHQQFVAQRNNIITLPI